MIDYLKTHVYKFLHNFARPTYLHRHQEKTIEDVDKRLMEVDNSQQEIRMRLLQIKGTPRGSIND